MNQPEQTTSHGKESNSSHTLIPLIGLVAGCGVVMGWVVFGSHGEAAAKTDAMKEPEAHATASVRPQSREIITPAVVTPDPHFVRREPPVVPVALSPESRGMVLAIQNKYSCEHCGGGKTTPQCLPGLGGNAGRDTQSLTDALRKSLGSLPDDCYVTTALPKIVDPKAPADLMNILFEDLLKRPNPIKLRMLFIIAGIEGHPLAASALENLRSAMKLDHQQDWPRWDQAVNQQCAREERGMRGASCRVH